MSPATFEQNEISREVIGPRAELLVRGMMLAIELLEGRPVHIDFSDVLEVKVTNTAPPTHQQPDSNFKLAKLEDGIAILVPQFIKTGDFILLNVENRKYMARADAKSMGA
jgi:elongation factor P